MATRVTVANNAKQSQKAPLLVPASAATDPAATTSMRLLIFKTAQSKLKLKKPSRVFVKQTGQELVSEEDWKNNIKNDIVLLVSAGEEYVGIKKEMIVHGECTSMSTFEHIDPYMLHKTPRPLTFSRRCKSQLSRRSPRLQCTGRVTRCNAAHHYSPHASRNRSRSRPARSSSRHQVPHRRRLCLQEMDTPATHWRRYRLRYGMVQAYFTQKPGRR